MITITQRVRVATRWSVQYQCASWIPTHTHTLACYTVLTSTSTGTVPVATRASPTSPDHSPRRNGFFFSEPPPAPAKWPFRYDTSLLLVLGFCTLETSILHISRDRLVGMEFWLALGTFPVHGPRCNGFCTITATGYSYSAVLEMVMIMALLGTLWDSRYRCVMHFNFECSTYYVSCQKPLASGWGNMQHVAHETLPRVLILLLYLLPVALGLENL